MQLTNIHSYSPSFYGAMGDGVTDDTSAIQAAINDAHSAGGGAVYFFPGTYLISSPLVLPRTGDASPPAAVWLIGEDWRSVILKGSGGFSSGPIGMVQWAAVSSDTPANQMWAQRIANISFSLPLVSQARAIYYSPFVPLSSTSVTSIQNEWLQLDLENIRIYPDNVYHDVSIDLGIGCRLSTWRNISQDPWRGNYTGLQSYYATLLFKFPYQYNSADPPLGEDSIGFGLGRIEQVFTVVLQGGWARAFEGRIYGSVLDTWFDNGSRSGDGYINYHFINSCDCHCRNLLSEGGGGLNQMKIEKCRTMQFDSCHMADGYPTELGWTASTAHAIGDRVVSASCKTGMGTVTTNKVFQCTTAGTTGGSEPSWPASGTVTDGTVVWTVMSIACVGDTISVVNSREIRWKTRFANENAIPASTRFVHALTIDNTSGTPSQNCQFENFTLRIVASGNPLTDAANEISMDLTTAARIELRNRVSGVGTQFSGDYRELYQFGVGPEGGWLTLLSPVTTGTTIGAGTVYESGDISMPGVVVNDSVAMAPPSEAAGFFNSGLVAFGYVKDTGIVRARIFNGTAAGVFLGAQDFTFNVWHR